MKVMSWKGTFKDRAGILAFLVSGAVFALLSLSRDTPQSARPVLVPIVRKDVLAGSRIEPSDIEWISLQKIHAVSLRELEGFAKTSLFSGEVLSPQAIGKASENTVIVAVSPTISSDINVAHVGDFVDVLVQSGRTMLWQSGALPVESVSTLTGSGATVNVMMPWRDAMHYEQMKNMGTIALVGMDS